MRPLYIVGTQRDIGKTTFCVGIINALRARGLKVGYTKPMGQRVSNVSGRHVHDDALVITRAMEMADPKDAELVLSLTRGQAEKEINNPRQEELAKKIKEVCDRLQAQNDVVVIEGMGHVAMGSCFKFSAGDVSRTVGARPILISGGGIGRTIDEISLYSTFMESRGAPLIGAVINKVWPEKYDRIWESTTKGLKNIGVQSFGCIPYEPLLASPTILQVSQRLNAEILCGEEFLENRVGKIIVAAMEADHVVSYLEDRVLVITPGDRSDNILAILSTHLLESFRSPVSGIILTGGFRPSGKVMSLLAGAKLPAMFCREDTYTLAAKLSDTVFKLSLDDNERIEAAICLINEYVDVDGIIAALED